MSFDSVQFNHLVVSNSLWPHGLQYARLPYRSPTPGACSNWCSLSQWCHPTISSSVIPFSSCLQSFPASGSFPMSQFFSSGGQSIGASASASVLPISLLIKWHILGLVSHSALPTALWAVLQPAPLTLRSVFYSTSYLLASFQLWLLQTRCLPGGLWGHLYFFTSSTVGRKQLWQLTKNAGDESHLTCPVAS